MISHAIKQIHTFSADFCTSNFPIKIAIKNLAKIFRWQSNFLIKVTKGDRKQNQFCIKIPKATFCNLNFSWPMLAFKVHSFFPFLVL